MDLIHSKSDHPRRQQLTETHLPTRRAMRVPSPRLPQRASKRRQSKAQTTHSRREEELAKAMRPLRIHSKRPRSLQRMLSWTPVSLQRTSTRWTTKQAVSGRQWKDNNRSKSLKICTIRSRTRSGPRGTPKSVGRGRWNSSRRSVSQRSSPFRRWLRA